MTANVMSCITLFYYAFPSYLANLSSYSSNSMLKISIIGLLMMCIFGLLSALLIKKDSIQNWIIGSYFYHQYYLSGYAMLLFITHTIWLRI